jgi:hypothetical protein
MLEWMEEFINDSLNWPKMVVLVSSKEFNSE